VSTHAVGAEDVRAAAERIRPHVHRTPVMTSRRIDALAGRRIFFKCENLQRIGAFKIRGAMNAVMQLTDAEAARGVVTHSSGNHAQALALAARTRGIPATIVMPSNAPVVKRRAVEGYGATVVPCEPTLEARETATRAIIDRTGAVLVHPYDDPRVIAGQGTMALELLAETGPLDAVVAPVGGGGMMSGICIATRSEAPGTRLLGAEPAGADDAARSLAAGRLIPQTGPHTIADGLLTSLGDLTWPILRDHLEGIVTVDDAAITAAMRLVFEAMKLVVEPSGAVGLAAVLDPAFETLAPGARQVGVVLCGGNVDLDRLPWMTND
jgi:threonine dehydratase/serine racemase